MVEEEEEDVAAVEVCAKFATSRSAFREPPRRRSHQLGPLAVPSTSRPFYEASDSLGEVRACSLRTRRQNRSLRRSSETTGTA